MAAYSSAICMRLDNSTEPPPLRFAKHPERAEDLRPTRQPGIELARSWLGLEGRLLARPLGGVSRKERGDDPLGGRHPAEASTLCRDTIA